MVLLETPQIDGALALQLLSGILHHLQLIVFQTENLGVLLHQVVQRPHHVGEVSAGVALLQGPLHPHEHLGTGSTYAADAAEAANIEFALKNVGGCGNKAVGGGILVISTVHHQLPVPTVAIGCLTACSGMSLVHGKAIGIGDDGVEGALVGHQIIKLVAYAGIRGICVLGKVPIVSDVVFKIYLLGGSAIGIVAVIFHLCDEEGHILIFSLILIPNL